MMLQQLLYVVTFSLIISNHCVRVHSFVCKELATVTDVGFLPTLVQDFLKDDLVQFYLYTNAINGSEKIYFSGLNYRWLNFDPDRKTTIIVHGYVTEHSADWIQNMIKQLLKSEDMNVIAVDWYNIFKAYFYNYRSSAVKTQYVAEKINILLRTLATMSRKNLKDWRYLHLLGHSLGAHVVGQAADKLKSSVFVHRVTGFDPAKPYFDKEGVRMKLDKSCAQFVDVIHTNSNPQGDTFGMYQPIGHIDFYPNGGDRQPACSTMERTAQDDSIIGCLSYFFLGIDATGLLVSLTKRQEEGDNMGCDHGQGTIYYTESIGQKKKYLAFKVDFPIQQNKTKCKMLNCAEETCVEMGANAVLYNDPKYYGTYYLDIPNCSK